MAIPSNNTSGFRGVNFEKRRNKWKARLMIDGKEIYLGYFVNKEDAINAYKEGLIKYGREYYIDPDWSKKKYWQKYRKKNSEKLIIKNREYRKNNKEKCHKYSKEYNKMNKNIISDKGKARRHELRKEIINIYGGRCVCCGEDNICFLTIDHVHNNGAKERKEQGNRGGHAFYLWLKKKGFPKEDYCIMCWNCNCAKGIYGECPHKSMINNLIRENTNA